ncbi:MAG TPA: hypothetical protein PL045_00770 [Chitinophagaceae bacterium]|nr:hypothetical protein [Chitinophagaceae bacterium]
MLTIYTLKYPPLLEIDYFKIIDIFAVIGIGLFTVGACAYCYFLIKNLISFGGNKSIYKDYSKWLAKTISNDNNDRKGFLYGVLLILLIYSVGILTTSLTDYLSDSNDEKNAFLLKPLKCITDLEDEKNVMQEVLIKKVDYSKYDYNSLFSAIIKYLDKVSICLSSSDMDKCDRDSIWSLTSLGKAVFGNAKIDSEANNALKQHNPFFDYTSKKSNVEDDLHEIFECVKCSYLDDKNYKAEFDDFVSQIYFTAKNWCYVNGGEPLIEIKNIQNQIDFSRSIAYISVLILLITSVFFFLELAADLFYSLYSLILVLLFKWAKIIRSSYIKNYIRPKLVGKIRNQKDKASAIVSRFKKALTYYVVGIILLLSIWFYCRQAYYVSCINFDRRAFGYYSSHMNGVYDSPKSKDHSN